ncbi:hypothetical protein BaRGS_00034819, partial [Batillaria attramentaria]
SGRPSPLTLQDLNGVPDSGVGESRVDRYRHATSASFANSPASSATTAATSAQPQSQSSSSCVAQDYPIRGTMSPLTSHVSGSVRRGGGRTVSASASASGQVVVEREVLSPPPTSSLSSWGEGRMQLQGGVCCEHCNGCLIELKRQALRLMFPDNGNGTCLAQFPLSIVRPWDQKNLWGPDGKADRSPVKPFPLEQGAVSSPVIKSQRVSRAAIFTPVYGHCSHRPERWP